MRVAVLSDIHGNLHALEAVLADIDRDGRRRGLVPRRRRRLRAATRTSASPSSASGRPLPLRQPRSRRRSAALDIADFSGDAGVAARWTQTVLGAEQRAGSRLAARRRARRASSSSTAARATRSGTTCSASRSPLISLLETTAPLVLVGHSHVALALALGRRRARRRPRTRRHRGRASPAAAGSLNPGSVGQPRDGDPRAAWAAARPRRGRARRSGESPTRSSRRRPRSASAGCRRRSRSGSRTASETRARAQRAAAARRARGSAEGDALAGERDLDVLARLEDPPLDGRERDLERVGDLVVREPDDVAQEQRHLQVDGQPVDRPPERVDRLDPLDRLVERLERRRRRRARPAPAAGAPWRAARRGRGSSSPGTARS